MQLSLAMMIDLGVSTPVYLILNLISLHHLWHPPRLERMVQGLNLMDRTRIQTRAQMEVGKTLVGHRALSQGVFSKTGAETPNHRTPLAASRQAPTQMGLMVRSSMA